MSRRWSPSLLIVRSLLFALARRHQTTTPSVPHQLERTDQPVGGHRVQRRIRLYTRRERDHRVERVGRQLVVSTHFSVIGVMIGVGASADRPPEDRRRDPPGSRDDGSTRSRPQRRSRPEQASRCSADVAVTPRRQLCERNAARTPRSAFVAMVRRAVAPPTAVHPSVRANFIHRRLNLWSTAEQSNVQHRSRSSLHQHRSHAGHGRRSESRSPVTRNSDGARTARLRAVHGPCDTIRAIRIGPTAIASCCRAATRRCSCIRCLYLSGYNLTLEDLKQFRQWESKTPGHPELGYTAASRRRPVRLGRASATP